MVTACKMICPGRNVAHVVMVTLHDAAGPQASIAQAGSHMFADVHLASCRVHKKSADLFLCSTLCRQLQLQLPQASGVRAEARGRLQPGRLCLCRTVSGTQGLISVRCHAGLFSGEAQDIILGILLIFVLPGVVLVACLAVVARLVIREGQAVYACKQCKDTGPKVSSTSSCPDSGDVTRSSVHPCVWGAGVDRLSGPGSLRMQALQRSNSPARSA